MTFQVAVSCELDRCCYVSIDGTVHIVAPGLVRSFTLSDPTLVAVSTVPFDAGVVHRASFVRGPGVFRVTKKTRSIVKVQRTSLLKQLFQRKLAQSIIDALPYAPATLSEIN